MKYEDIQSDKFSLFHGSAFEPTKSIIGGNYITEGPNPGYVDYYETHTASGGDGVHHGFTLSGGDSYKDGYINLP